jgi:hypothetical protein
LIDSRQNFIFAKVLSSGANPASYSIGTGDASPRAEQLGYEVDYKPLLSAHVKNDWNYISTPTSCSTPNLVKKILE